MNATPPDYNTLYFDSNELLANGWPDASVKLHNLLYISHWWNVQPFVPQPVLDETEAHWLRTVETQASRLSSAKKELERIARPVECKVGLQYTDMLEMGSKYRAFRGSALQQFGIGVIPYPNRTAEFFFERAIRYVMPFEKEKEGKGFQDAVILQSVLEHLHANADLKGVLITKDGGVEQTRFREFLPEFDVSRLRISSLDEVWDGLYRYNFDQTVVQPWADERKNALAAAESLIPRWTNFLSTHLTEPMLRAGKFGESASVVKLISVDTVKVSFVDTPIPDLYGNPDREVKITLSVSAECTAIVKKEHIDFLGILGGSVKNSVQPTTPPEVVQEKASWSGGIRATARIVNRQFEDMAPESLVSEEELRAKK